jgi:hypothetical protein
VPAGKAGGPAGKASGVELRVGPGEPRPEGVGTGVTTGRDRAVPRARRAAMSPRDRPRPDPEAVVRAGPAERAGVVARVGPVVQAGQVARAGQASALVRPDRAVASGRAQVAGKPAAAGVPAARGAPAVTRAGTSTTSGARTTGATPDVRRVYGVVPKGEKDRARTEGMDVRRDRGARLGGRTTAPSQARTPREDRVGAVPSTAAPVGCRRQAQTGRLYEVRRGRPGHHKTHGALVGTKAEMALAAVPLRAVRRREVSVGAVTGTGAVPPPAVAARRSGAAPTAPGAVMTTLRAAVMRAGQAVVTTTGPGAMTPGPPA